MTMINGVNLTLTGNPQADLKTYMEARGCDEATAKSELQAQFGNPQVSAYDQDEDSVLELDNSSDVDDTSDTTSTTDKTSTTSTSATSSVSQDDVEEIDNLIDLVQEAIQRQADAYNIWAQSGFQDHEAAVMHFDTCQRFATRVAELQEKAAEVGVVRDEMPELFQEYNDAIALAGANSFDNDIYNTSAHSNFDTMKLSAVELMKDLRSSGY